MAQPYLDQLRKLVSTIDGRHDLVCKHFFSGAALYVDRKICASLTPQGLAFKLPDSRCRDHFDEGKAIPLRYFERSPVKKGYILFPSFRDFRDSSIASYLEECIAHVTKERTREGAERDGRPGPRSTRA